MELISVVVPCYNEEEVLPLFYREIKKVSDSMIEQYKDLDFEFLFINDGSKDKTLIELRKLAKLDKKVRYISFSRNFGKESGIYAGLKESNGDYVVVMDADLQHPPAFIPKMYKYVKFDGYDSSATRRISRKGESKIKSWFSAKFYKIINKISDIKLVDGAQDFRFMKRKMVDSVLQMSEYNRFTKGIFSWVGFTTKYIEYENVERAAGTTDWSLKSLLKYAIQGIIAFSTGPLVLPMYFGGIEMFVAIVLLIVAIFAVSKTIILMVAMCFGLIGIMTFSVGILGLYFSKMYLEVKHRPIYLVSETEKDVE